MVLLLIRGNTKNTAMKKAFQLFAVLQIAGLEWEKKWVGMRKKKKKMVDRKAFVNKSLTLFLTLSMV